MNEDNFSLAVSIGLFFIIILTLILGGSLFGALKK